MKYEWDEIKYQDNLKKHKIRFEIAQDVFADEMALEYFDEDNSTLTEKRFQRIGMSSAGILFVVFCEVIKVNGEEVTRIISAREATNPEKDRYMFT